MPFRTGLRLRTPPRCLAAAIVLAASCAFQAALCPAAAAPFTEHFATVEALVAARLDALGDGSTSSERREIRALRRVQRELDRTPVDIRQDVRLAVKIAAWIEPSVGGEPALRSAIDELARGLLVEARMRHDAAHDEARVLPASRQKTAALAAADDAALFLGNAAVAAPGRPALELTLKALNRLARAEKAIAKSGRLSVGDALHRSAGVIVDPAIVESSGLTVLDGAYWTLNDSGSAAVLYRATDLGFTDAEALPLAGASAVDWEEITVLDGDLLVCDFGDNDRVRDDLVLYRARYVPADAANAVASHLDLVAAYPIAYPDGRHDTEAAAVIDGKLHVVTKNHGEPDTGVYRFDTLTSAADLPPGARNTPAKIAALTLLPGEQATGAAARRGRGPLVLLTYSRVLVYETDGLAAAPTSEFPLSLLVTKQCEGIAFAGDRLVLTNEQHEVFAVPDFLQRR